MIRKLRRKAAFYWARTEVVPFWFYQNLRLSLKAKQAETKECVRTRLIFLTQYKDILKHQLFS